MFIVAFTVLVVVNKIAFLNCFYIPTLIAAYFLGKKKGVLISVIAVLMVTFYAVINPEIFTGKVIVSPIWNIVLWGSFLIITGIVVGSLYEAKEEVVTELEEAYIGILEILAKYIDSTDAYTQNHSIRVSSLAVEVAKAMELPDKQIENIRVAGLLHDLGKLELNMSILRKASELTEDEWKEVKTHTKRASSMLEPVGGLLKEVIPLIVSHHEHYDGGGYDRLKYDEIPLGSRILAVVDAYESMITDRPYRSGKTPHEAISEIKKYAGSQFDPEVAKVFLEVIQEEVQYA